MALLSKLLIPVIAGLSLVTTTVSYAQQVGFKYKVDMLVSYKSASELGNLLQGKIVEVGSCNEEIRKIDPDSDCHETHWYKIRTVIQVGTENGQPGHNVYALTDKYEYINQQNVKESLGMLRKRKKYE